MYYGYIKLESRYLLISDIIIDANGSLVVVLLWYLLQLWKVQHWVWSIVDRASVYMRIKVNGTVYKGLSLDFVTKNSLRHEDAVLQC